MNVHTEAPGEKENTKKKERKKRAITKRRSSRIWNN
jgi:hypothetical protein